MCQSSSMPYYTTYSEVLPHCSFSSCTFKRSTLQGSKLSLPPSFKMVFFTSSTLPGLEPFEPLTLTPGNNPYSFRSCLNLGPLSNPPPNPTILSIFYPYILHKHLFVFQHSHELPIQDGRRQSPRSPRLAGRRGI